MKPETSQCDRLPEEERQRLQEAFAIAQETGIRTVDFAAQRLRAVLTIGHTLNHWRARVAKDHWYAWLDVNVFPIVEITVRSLTNWMRLADSERAGKVKVEAGIGVRTALIQAGIIPAADKSKTEPTARIKGTPAIILAIVRVAYQAGRLDVVQLDAAQRATLRTALAQIGRLMERMAALPDSSTPDASEVGSGHVERWSRQNAARAKQTGRNSKSGTPPHKESLSN
jgi:hypothetical protein